MPPLSPCLPVGFRRTQAKQSIDWEMFRMNTFIANEEPQWIELGGGQRRKIRAYN